MKESKTQTSGISLGTILFLIFLILKLTNTGVVATWSWLAITAPLYIPVVIALVMFGVMVLIEKRK